MRKEKKYKKRFKINPDPKYNDIFVQMFINKLMWDGKKQAAYKIFYGMIDRLSEKTKENGLEVWRKALKNLCPNLEIKRRRIGGATLQVPVEVPEKRKDSLSMRWMIRYARERGEKKMVDKLTNEVLAAANNEGKAFKKKEDVQKMALSNKAFASLKF